MSPILVRLFFALLVISPSLPFSGQALASAVNLPQTGQTTCYDSSGTVKPCVGTGQDGDFQAGVAWPDPRFTVSGSCVTDNLPGLMWAKNANLPKGGITWQEALDYAKGLNLCGYSDWRLPNVNELESLFHAGQEESTTWLKTRGFANVQSAFPYWSSSSVASSPNHAWVVSISYGYVDVGCLGGKGDRYFVWPVRSGQ